MWRKGGPSRDRLKDHEAARGVACGGSFEMPFSLQQAPCFSIGEASAGTENVGDGGRDEGMKTFSLSRVPVV